VNVDHEPLTMEYDLVVVDYHVHLVLYLVVLAYLLLLVVEQ
jgi:hypothetical protein